MTYGNRLDTLNHHLLDWNMRKIRRMGPDLHQRLMKARNQVRLHSSNYDKFADALDPLYSSNYLEAWVDLEENYIPSVGQQSVYKAAAGKEATREDIIATITHSEMGDSAQPPLPNLSIHVLWMNKGLDIQREQRRLQLRSQKINSGAMEIDHDRLRNSRQALWMRINAWRTQAPEEVPQVDEEADFAHCDSNPEDEELILPSSLEIECRPKDFTSVEIELRKGQANQSLQTLRRLLSQQLVLRRELSRLDDASLVAVVPHLINLRPLWVNQTLSIR
ncbi:SubName: Full=Uncharacterized protein {ECO:0000313/EMBL:CCA76215.1} [Serendipita indica DSM 11827]|nr:SubName: Full=Uncharacterized protein {ECO:0000313/EMBL:CCA76215.1} [Serendipita indica DSM 11827]